MRMLSAEARVDSQRIRTGKLIESDWAKLAQAAGVLADANIHIDDTPAVSALELRAKARRLFARFAQTEQPIRLLMVDYLQLMRGNERVSGGLLWPDPNGNGYTLIQVPTDLQSFDSIGLTDEPGSGSVWPTTPRVVGTPLKETSN